VDVNPEAAAVVAEEYNTEYTTADYEKVLSDKDVDLVVITTRHDTHAEMTIRAARAGKHVLCEKPMGVTWDECRGVMDAVKLSGVKYCIGYNRGLAPLITQAGEIIARQDRAAVITHRIQVYYKGEFHWLLERAEGGGRLVGEGCHIFDLFCALAGSDPVRVSAEGGIFNQDPRVNTPDTALITVAFENGTIATVCIPSVGNAGLSKEATEIYCGNTAIHIDNFQTMAACIGEQKVEVDLGEIDKGHLIEINRLADAILTGAPCPNGLENAARAALIGFKAIEAIETHRVVPMSREEYKV
jgi:predicted dehydrogenase